MKTSLQMPEQRNLLKQEITELVEKTLPARILHFAGSWLWRQNSSSAWFINTILLEIIVVIPPILFAIVLKQPDQVIRDGLIWTISNIIVVSVVLATYLVTRYILAMIRDHIVENMERSQDLDNLRYFLLQIGNWQKTLFYSLVASAIWSAVAIPLFSFFKGSFIGISYSYDVWIWGFGALGIGSYFVIWLAQFPNQMASYQYGLYEMDPSRSEVISHLSHIFTRPFLALAIFLAVCTFIASLFEIFTWVLLVVVFVFWFPLIIQFFNSQRALDKIISAKKWQTLNSLQEEIHRRKKKITSPENLEVINKLMDLHEKVYASRNINLTIRRVVDLLNQLLLPLLAFLISNYEGVLKLFKLRP